MNFYKISSTETVAKIIADKIIHRLTSSEKVFWIVTGGSGIRLSAQASKLLVDQKLDNLCVTLTDERYGPVGHPESNWYQLEQAGFSLPGAKLLPVLCGKNREDSTNDYSQNLAEQFKDSDYSIGLFGIGPDGHTAGILPGSPSIDTDELASGFADNEVTQDSPEGVMRGIDRITLTSSAIAMLDEVIVCAMGESKHSALDLLAQDLSILNNPAQALKKAKILSVYSDYKGEPL